MATIETMMHHSHQQQQHSISLDPQTVISSATMNATAAAASNTIPLRRATYIKISDLTNTYNIQPTALEEELERINTDRENQLAVAAATTIEKNNSENDDKQSLSSLEEGIPVATTSSKMPLVATAGNTNSTSPVVVAQRLFTTTTATNTTSNSGGIPTELDTSIKKRLQPPRGGNNMVVLVGKVRVVVDKYRVDGSRVRLAVVEVGDETGCVSLRARDEQIDILQNISNVNCAVVLRNCTQELYQGRHIRLAVTKWGKISPYPDYVASTPPPPTIMNRERNFSMINLSLIAGDMSPPQLNDKSQYSGHSYHHDTNNEQQGNPTTSNMQRSSFSNHNNNRRSGDRRPSRGTPTTTSSSSIGMSNGSSIGTPLQQQQQQQLHMNSYQNMNVVSNPMSPHHQPGYPGYGPSAFTMSTNNVVMGGVGIPQYYTPQRQPSHHDTSAQQQQQQQQMMYLQQQHQNHSYNVHHQQQQQQQQQQHHHHQMQQQHLYHQHQHQHHRSPMMEGHQPPPPPPPPPQQQQSSSSHFTPVPMSFQQNSQLSGPYSHQGSNMQRQQQQHEFSQQQQTMMNAQAATYDPNTANYNSERK